eukprot:8634497-Pyramimonas_sp.AAC.1
MQKLAMLGRVEELYKDKCNLGKELLELKQTALHTSEFPAKSEWDELYSKHAGRHIKLKKKSEQMVQNLEQFVEDERNDLPSSWFAPRQKKSLNSKSPLRTGNAAKPLPAM